MKTFLKFALKPQWKLISIILILIVVQTILQLTILNLFDASLNYVETGNINQVIHNGEIMVIQTIMLVLLLIVSTLLSNKVSSNAAYRTRQKIFHILTYLPLEEINNFKHTGLMSRTTRGVFSEQGFILVLLRDLLPIPIITVGVIIEIYLINPEFATYFIIYVVVAMFLFIFRMNEIVKIYFKAKKTFGKINQLFREKILGAKTIRIFQRQNFENEKFKKASLNSYDKSVTSLLSQYYFAPLILLIFDITIVIILAFMSLDRSIGTTMTYGEITDLVMNIQYVLYFMSNLVFLPKFVERWPKSYATSVRIEEVLAIEDKIHETENKVKKSDFKGIEFRNVSFKQNEHEIIRNVSFKIPAGSTAAIVGAASSGKTTLMYLLDKLLLLNEGEILIDGFDINDCTSKDVRSQISFAMQKDFILNDTVLNNIVLGDESITREMVTDACRKTGLDKLLKNKNIGLDSEIAENESNISGEFKNRLTLTRAIAHDRDIYIFDDYKYIMDNRTNIILTQDVNSIKDIDHIIVLESGRIVGEGDHEKLISECSEYQKLCLRGEAC